jgi:hypothetical protein
MAKYTNLPTWVWLTKRLQVPRQRDGSPYLPTLPNEFTSTRLDLTKNSRDQIPSTQ